MSELPRYDPDEPARLQELDSDCAVESTEWALYAWGRTPDDNWLEDSMRAAGVWNESVGLTDASGGLLAEWCNSEYGEFGYYAENVNPVSFDDLAAEAATRSHPIMAGGRGWYHWTGVRGFDGDAILLANPAPGWGNVWDRLTRSDFERLGSWSMVRLMHPEAEGMVDAPSLPDEPDYAGPADVGSGLLEMMAADNTKPAAPSTFLPLGRSPALIEECVGLNGMVYRFHLPSGRRWRYPPA